MSSLRSIVSPSDAYFNGDRLSSEVLIHARLSFAEDLADIASLQSDLSELALSYGIESDANKSSPLLVETSDPDIRSINIRKNRYQQSASDRYLLQKRIVDDPTYPDAYLGYCLFYILPKYSGDHSQSLAYLRAVISCARLSCRDWPLRTDLISSFSQLSGELAYQKYYPRRSVSASSFYQLTSSSLAFLQELWAKGQYSQIYTYYSEYQLSARAFPKSDFMLRALTIIGLHGRCRSLFRSIYLKHRGHIQAMSLSNIIFTELGQEEVDSDFLLSVVKEWRLKGSLVQRKSHQSPTVELRSEVTQTINQPIQILEKPSIVVSSADLRSHPVGRFWLPVAKYLSRDFNLFYLDHSPTYHDVIKSELQSSSAGWYSFSSHEEANILPKCNDLSPALFVDLGGHTADNRPVLLNHRIAPVQVSYLGFYGPSYAIECDWWLIDKFIEPYVRDSYPGSEQIWSLSCPSLCYDYTLHNLPNVKADAYACPRIMTIGSFNHTRKLSPEAIDLISSVLRHCTTSILQFRAHSFYDASVRSYFLQRFVDHGVRPDQLVAIPYASNPTDAMLDFLRLHFHIDTYPVSGTTTTLDSLAMGIPVLSMPSDLYAGSISSALLQSIGLTDFVVEHREDYASAAKRIFHKYKDASARHSLAEYVRNSAICCTKTVPAGIHHAFGSMIRSAHL